MSYRIGQIRKSNSTTYLNDLAYTESTIRTAGYANKQFNDYAIQLAEGTFNANNTYYLRFTVNRLYWNDERFRNYAMTRDANDPREMIIKLELFKNDGSETDGEYELGTYQVIQNMVRIDPYIEGENSPQASFETIFTPNDSYAYLGFVLSRTQYDYLSLIGPRDDIRGNIDFSEKGDLCTINNILPRQRVDKIGIQSRPGSLLCINREAMRIGRSGTLEVNNGVPISYVGFVAPNGSNATNIDKFIFDYAWDE